VDSTSAHSEPANSARGSPPQAERVVERGDARRRARLRRGLDAQALESCRVDAIRGDFEGVAARSGLERDTTVLREELA
jgi:hypothetical protein